ncbi:hypothetical protein CGQ24_08140 [Arthrobacter sp. 7749]|nr:hypothetical protein CGQ24_08140 [Arthrobacter sp. 7749]
MATSQNGWPVLSGYSDSKLTRSPYITGKVLEGDVEWILNDFGAWFNANVEALDVGVDDDWGFAPRNIGGSSIISNHASGTAWDWNAVRHPQFRDTMDSAKEAKIRKRLKRYSGALRWGGDYRTGRLDQMHFEINVTPARLKTIVTALKSGTVAPVATKPKPKPSTAAKAWPDIKLIEDGDFKGVSVEALQTMLAGIDLYDGKIDGSFDSMTKAALQQWLKQLGYYKGWIDGDFKDLSIRALQTFLVAKHLLPSKLYIDDKLGKVTGKAFQKYINSQTHYFK